MQENKEITPEEEKQQIMDELIELLELQIKLKEGGIPFKIAHALGMRGTRLEHIQKELKKRLAIKIHLKKEDTETLRRDVELTKMRLKGIDVGFEESQKSFRERILRIEDVMKNLEKTLGKEEINQ